MASFGGLGFLPAAAGVTPLSRGFAVSPTGDVAYAYSVIDVIGGQNQEEAFYRPIFPFGAIQRLGDFAGGSVKSAAHASSNNGALIVGRGDTGLPQAAYWNGALAPNALPALAGSVQSVARDCNRAGNRIVGQSRAANGKRTAVIWVNTGAWQVFPMEDLPGSAAVAPSIAYGISRNSQYVVGKSNQSAAPFRDEAVQWDPAANPIACSSLHAGPADPSIPAKALAVSDNGIVVGQCCVGGVKANRAFHYDLNSPGFDILAGLPHVTLQTSKARDVDANGNVIVGSYNIGCGDVAFVWFRAAPAPLAAYSGQMLSVKWVLERLHSNPRPDGWTLIDAHSVSSDGTVIVGWGLDQDFQVQGWAADISP